MGAGDADKKDSNDMYNPQFLHWGSSETIWVESEREKHGSKNQLPTNPRENITAERLVNHRMHFVKVDSELSQQ